MPKICYQKKRFSETSKDLIKKANEIISEYQAEGFTLTLRQLYYQFVSRDWLVNSVASYKVLGSVISNARIAGLIDWDAIEDRTRFLRTNPTWDSPSDIVSSCAAQFDVDRWETQDYRPEVWIEKDALVGILEQACNKWQVPYFSCRGYTSDSEIWGAAQRMRKHIKAGKTPWIIHLGDHDPSGIDMTRDVTRRLQLFSGSPIPVKRIALNMHQIRQFNPPPNPAKSTDTRYANYLKTYGNESWELDALSPVTITELIDSEIDNLIDHAEWAKKMDEMKDGRKQLRAISENWNDVIDGLPE